MASNTTGYPSYLIAYYEYDRQIESSIEISQKRIVIDGFFDPNRELKVSLGYFVNINRYMQTLELLVKIGIMKITFIKLLNSINHI
jgi:hypothetical protein